VGEIEVTFRFTEIAAYVLVVVFFGLIFRFTGVGSWAKALWREAREASARFPDGLPWDRFLGEPYVDPDEAIILNHQGGKGPSLQKTFRVSGPDVGALSHDEKLALAEQLRDAFAPLRAGKGWCVYFTAPVKASPAIPESRFTNPLAWELDEERREAYAAAELFEAGAFITFVWERPSKFANGLQKVLMDAGAADEDVDGEALLLRRDCAEFLQTLHDVFGGVKPHFAFTPLSRRETLTTLKSLISTNDQEVFAPFPGTMLNEFLPDQPFIPGATPRLGDTWVPICTITGYADSKTETDPADLDILTRRRFPLVLTLRCHFLPEDVVRKRLEERYTVFSRASRTFKDVAKEKVGGEVGRLDRAMADKAAEVDEALRQFGAGDLGFVEVTTTVATPHTSRRVALERKRQIKEVARTRGYVVKDETLNAVNAFRGSIPGNTEVNRRRDLLTDVNFADMLPAYTVYCGEHYSKPLAKLTGQHEALIYASTGGSTPFRLNLERHALIVGGTRGGKTVLLLLMGAQFLRFSNARVIIFDRDYSARALTMAMGGSFFEPGKVGARSGFQPFAHVDNLAERIAAANLVMTMFKEQGLPDTPAHRSKVAHALELLAARPRKQRTFTQFWLLLADDQRLQEALRPYTREGHFGHIFDADEEVILDASWIVFEMSHLVKMGDAVVTPALQYIFHRLEQLFDGRPTMLAIDEFSSLQKQEIFGGRIGEYLERVAKMQVWVVVVTHEIQKVAASKIFPELDVNCTTKILLPDGGAAGVESAKVYKSLSPALTDTDLQILAGMQPQRDYYFVGPHGKRVFSLDLGPLQQALLSMTSAQHQPILDEIAAKVPPDAYGEAILQHLGRHGEAELLRQASRGPRELIARQRASASSALGRAEEEVAA
jgi:type IV secretory pathway VirB4 component